MKFIHIREPDQREEAALYAAHGMEGGKQIFHPRNAMTIAYEIMEDSHRASVGFSLCKATRKLPFSKKMGRKIASDRLVSNPLKLEIDGDLEFTPHLLVTLLRGLLIERPKWTEMDSLHVLKPTRFDSRWETEWLGPDGLVASAEVDAKELSDALRAAGARRDAGILGTWAMRIPRWSIEFATEHMA